MALCGTTHHSRIWLVFHSNCVWGMWSPTTAGNHKANLTVYHCQSQTYSLTRSLCCLMASHRNLATLGMDGMLEKLLLMLFTKCGFFLTQKTKTRSRMRTASVTPTAIPTGVETARKEAHLYKKLYFANVFLTGRRLKIYLKHQLRWTCFSRRILPPTLRDICEGERVRRLTPRSPSPPYWPF